MKLTDKQKLFVKEYLIDLNATKAAIRAGYSRKTARVQGHENLTKPYIQQEIEAVMKKRAEKLNLTSEFVVQHLVELVERNMGNREGYKFDAMAAIGALRLLGKHLGMFKGQPKAQSEPLGRVVMV